ncbi:MAG: YibE/F family protein [Anaerovoracaceae bacterium]|jgi:uncharacterized membrane protein
MEKEKKDIRQIVMIVLILAAVIVCSLLVYRANPMDVKQYDTADSHYCKAVVTKVNDEEISETDTMPGWKLGNQNVTVKITSGEYKGEEATFDNNLSTTHSVYVKKGTHVIVNVDSPEGVEPYYSIYQYDRTAGMIAVMIIFIALMALVGRWKGVRAALGLLAAAVLICFVLIPTIFTGKPPVLMTLAVCTLITVVSMIFLNGPGAKSLTSIISTIIGLGISAGFYGIFALMLHMTGYNTGEAEELQLISSSTGLHIREILFCGILLSSLGAVMDISISVASSLFEIRRTNPDMQASELFKSGMAIGQDMIGTMCQTLILAFAGSSLATLLVVVSYGTQFYQFICSDMMMIEILQSMTGSAAVIAAVPVTAFLSTIFFKGENPAGVSVRNEPAAKKLKKRRM